MRTEEILSKIDEHYSRDMVCYLHYDTPWQLLVATILSAQCTDERVNQVTESLFKKYETIEAFAEANPKELEKDIRPAGFQRSKAANIIGAAKLLISQHGGQVPSDIDELIKLPGVGRKTANVIRGNIYNIPSIVVDTHVKRISQRLGFTKNEDPVKIERDLMEVLPKDHWIIYNIQIIAFGREICTARSPKCEECFLKDYCVRK